MNAARRRVLLFFLKGYWKAYALIAAFSAFLAALEAAHLALLYPIINEVVGTQGAAPGRLGRAVYSLLDLTPFGDRLVAGCVLLLVLTPIKGALVVAYERLIAWAAGRVLFRTKERILDEYSRAPYQFFLDHRIGELQFFALTAPTRAALILTRLPQMLVEGLRVTAIVALLFTINRTAAVVLIALGLAAQFLVGWLTHRVSYALGRERVESGTKMNSYFNELVTGIKQIRVFGSQDWWLERFREASRRYSFIFTRDAALLAVPRTMIETVVFLALAGWLLMMRLKHPGELQAAMPMAGTFAMGLMRLLPSLANLSRMRIEVTNSMPDLEGIHQSLMVELNRPAELPRRHAGRLEKELRLSDLRFGYTGRPGLLDGIDLAIPAGTSAALVGDSGSGKTTLLNLILGLYTPTGGRILVDDVPLDEIDLRSWSARIGLVTQEAFIFNGTVSENIVFGRPGFRREDVERAARIAHAHDFIAAMPQGYDTTVGERGLKLSGGQQQRLAIARAVLGSPEILLFDEATSALDSVSEAAVQEAINEASRGRTVIQIAHRLSTIENATRIFVLHAGRVAEEGSHSELLALGGRYATFHSLQTSGKRA